MYVDFLVHEVSGHIWRGEQKTIVKYCGFQKYTSIKLKNRLQSTQLFHATDSPPWETKIN